MGREKERIAKRLEKNPVVECRKIQMKFYPELFASVYKGIHNKTTKYGLPTY